MTREQFAGLANTFTIHAPDWCNCVSLAYECVVYVWLPCGQTTKRYYPCTAAPMPTEICYGQSHMHLHCFILLLFALAA